MAYVDANFNATEVISLGSPNNTISLSTSTASGTNTFVGTNTAVTGTIVMPKFVNPTKITAIRGYCMTAAAASVPNVGIYFINGTNTFGTITATTAPAAGSTYDATLSSNTVASNGAITNPAWFTTSNGQALVTVLLQTATVSGGTVGAWSFDIYTQPLFVS